MSPARLSRRRLLGLSSAALVASGVVASGCSTRITLPPAQRCIATIDESSVVITLEQAHYAAIIAGVSVQLGLAPRAASIALATAYQESGIRNLDYGDRDSIGLFQQRPSQGWGTKQQIMDPYYATRKFYAALVKIKNWDSGDINDVAQAVQRSGVPDGYRDHVADARVLASARTGQTAAAFSGVDRRSKDVSSSELLASVKDALGVSRTSVNGQRVIFTAGNTDHAWAVAAHLVAHAGTFGVADVSVGARTWTHADDAIPSWTKQDTTIAPSGQVYLTLR